MKQLKDRWHSSEEKVKLHSEIIKSLQSGADLSKIKGLQKHEDRWDLRGITTPVQLAGTSSDNTVFRINNVRLESVDFSGATLYESVWEKCQFSNVLFDTTKLDYSRFWACEFENASFKKTHLNDVLMNGTTMDNSRGYFKNVVFDEANMQGTTYSNTLFQQCRFQNCRIHNIDFNGSRFEDCEFIGELSEVFFHGNQVFNASLDSWRKPLPNRMVNVDFSKAKLVSVEFLDSINLNQCIFPDSEDYIIIRKNKRKIFEEARRIISAEWTGQDRSVALTVIDLGYLSKRKELVDMEVVDRHHLQTKNPDLNSYGEKFFLLIKNLNEKLNGNN